MRKVPSVLYFNKILKKHCLYLLLLLLASNGSAQSANQFIKLGDESFSTGNYYAAAEYFRKGLEKYEDNLEIKFKYAESCRLFNDYKHAADAYKDVIAENKNSTYPYAQFWYAEMLMNTGKYDLASKQFQRFITKYKKKDFFTQKAQQQIASCTWAKVNFTDTHKINILHLEKEINSEYNEFNPIENKDGSLLFTSMRNSGTQKSQKFLAKIYESDSSGKNVKIYPITASSEDKHLANACFDEDFKTLYFAQCENFGKLRCELFESKLINEKWTDATLLSDKVNKVPYTATQPNIGKDAMGNKVLYFISDRINGYGKTDIWQAKLNVDGSIGDVSNVGDAINTPDEEYSPFWDGTSNKLYFASNWHYGFGGLDIFSTENKNGAWEKPVNLGASVNSSANDFYYYSNSDNSKKYFASNRKGSFFLKAETCCNDIWMWKEKVENRKQKTDSVIVALVDTAKDQAQKTKDKTTIAENQKSDSTTVAENLKPKITNPKLDTIPNSKPPTSFIDSKVKKIKQLLPVTLYFHNDEPECCNLHDSTNLNYVETYEKYTILLNEYKREFAKGLSEGKKIDAEQAIFYLFTNRVDKGFRDLVQFSGQLLDILQSGEKMEVTIQGYCSPLNYNAYNIKLGYRRIASLKNYFYHYRDGILLPYIQEGKLILKNQSIGEETADKKISDNREDTRNSVYNPDAAKERKVEVISVEIK